MGAYNPPPGEGLHFRRHDRDGQLVKGWFGSMNIEIGTAFAVMFAEGDSADYYIPDPVPATATQPMIPSGLLRLWYSQGDMDIEINDQYGGMGNFYWGKPGDPAHKGVIAEAQPIINWYLDPTPDIPAHTNNDPASMRGLNEIGKKYLIAPEDPTFVNAPLIQPNPNPGP